MNHCYNLYENFPIGLDHMFWCSECKCKIYNKVDIGPLSYTEVKFCPNCGYEVINYSKYKNLSLDDTKLGDVK